MSKNVRLEIHGLDNAEHIITGRLLGVITEEEFSKLINSCEFQKKVFSKESIPVASLFKILGKEEGHRLVVAVKEKWSDDVEDKDLPQKTLFVSAGLEMISEIRKSKEATINAGENTFIFVEEI
jgi:hypothetical protein